jgi:carboxyl-terminal processing protease
MGLAVVLLLGVPPDPPFDHADRAFQEARRLLETTYAEPVAEDQLFRGAVEGMLARAGGRRWDRLLSPAEFAALESDLKGEVVGIGIEIKHDPETGLLSVRNVLPGSGAEAAGLRPGDQILKVDGRALRGRAEPEVVAALRGKPGSTAALRVLQGDRIVDLTVRRGTLVFDRVTTLPLPRDVALVTIRSFTERTPTDLRAALEATRGARALVIDLRRNPGGLLDRTLDCAGLLLPGGTPIASMRARGGDKPLVATPSSGLPPQRPLAVLVDGDTASSAEVLASALRSSLHARLVGKRTLGKWNVQRLERLANGYVMRWTVGVLRASDGTTPDGQGIAPDVPVEMAPGEVERAQRLTTPAERLAADPQLAAAVGLL